MLNKLGANIFAITAKIFALLAFFYRINYNSINA